jgi:hypothetical protein
MYLFEPASRCRKIPRYPILDLTSVLFRTDLPSRDLDPDPFRQYGSGPGRYKVGKTNFTQILIINF